jgi:hypothetical protein
MANAIADGVQQSVRQNTVTLKTNAALTIDAGIPKVGIAKEWALV